MLLPQINENAILQKSIGLHGHVMATHFHKLIIYGTNVTCPILNYIDTFKSRFISILIDTYYMETCVDV